MSPAFAIANSVLQVFIFAFVPFVFYLVSRRSVKGFLSWIGLYAPTRQPMFWATLFIVVTAPLPVLLYLLPEFREISLAQGTTGGDFSAMSPSVATAIVILVWAFLRAGLAEELLFRGFVGKRLIALMGFG